MGGRPTFRFTRPPLHPDFRSGFTRAGEAPFVRDENLTYWPAGVAPKIENTAATAVSVFTIGAGFADVPDSRCPIP
jgi:hypothetical protein